MNALAKLSVGPARNPEPHCACPAPALNLEAHFTSVAGSIQGREAPKHSTSTDRQPITTSSTNIPHRPNSSIFASHHLIQHLCTPIRQLFRLRRAPSRLFLGGATRTGGRHRPPRLARYHPLWASSARRPLLEVVRGVSNTFATFVPPILHQL
jgi:hypothetical protein